MIQAREGVALHQLLKDLLASEPSEVLTTPTALEMARRQLVASVVLVLFQLAGAQEPARVLGERRREIARAAEELHTGTAARIRPRSYKLDRVSSALAVSPRTVQSGKPAAAFVDVVFGRDGVVALRLENVYPQIIDCEAIRAVLVEAVLRRAGNAAAGQEEGGAPFYIELDPGPPA